MSVTDILLLLVLFWGTGVLATLFVLALLFIAAQHK